MRYLCASALNRTFEKIWESNFGLICYGQSTRDTILINIFKFRLRRWFSLMRNYISLCLRNPL